MCVCVCAARARARVCARPCVCVQAWAADTRADRLDLARLARGLNLQDLPCG